MISWKAIMAGQFEELCRALLQALGFQAELQGKLTAPDEGVDIRMKWVIEVPIVNDFIQNWVVQVKHSESVSHADMFRSLVAAVREQAQGLIVMTSALVAPRTKETLENEGHALGIEVRIWDRNILENLLASYPEVAQQYFEVCIEPSEIGRTYRIIQELSNLAANPPNDGKRVIRIQAGLSSFAIADGETDKDPAYYKLLIEERNTLEKLVMDEQHKWRFYCIISPHFYVKSKTGIKKPSIILLRYEKLLGFLQELKRREMTERCQFVCGKRTKMNQFILAEKLVIEGYKMQLRSGFPLTLFHSNPDLVRFEIETFDKRFETAREEQLARYAEGHGEKGDTDTDHMRLNIATQKEIEGCMEELGKSSAT